LDPQALLAAADCAADAAHLLVAAQPGGARRDRSVAQLRGRAERLEAQLEAAVVAVVGDLPGLQRLLDRRPHVAGLDRAPVRVRVRELDPADGVDRDELAATEQQPEPAGAQLGAGIRPRESEPCAAVHVPRWIAERERDGVAEAGGAGLADPRRLVLGPDHRGRMGGSISRAVASTS